MLWELSVTEQRYRAVLEVMAGVPVTEVAGRYGVSRQGVHGWPATGARGRRAWRTAAIGYVLIRGRSRRSWSRRASCAGRTASGVGLAHTRKTAEVTVEADTYQITVEPGITITAPRTNSRDIRRHKASNYD